MKKVKLFNDDKLIYEGNLAVNTAFLRGRIYKNVEKFGSVYHFTVKLSNGKDEKTGEWRKPTYADCTAVVELGEKVHINYCTGDEIVIIGKFYANKIDDKVYKGFNVREVIGLQVSEPQSQETKQEESTEWTDEDLPF